jgi:probable rRNA maturation factor
MFILPDEFDEAASEGIALDCADVPFPDINSSKISDWIQSIVLNHSKKSGSIQYVFCSDDYLQKINWEHLQHEELTDIITFEYNAEPLEGEIYISTERVLDNSQLMNLPYEDELLRVIAHGVLHLCGYRDKTPEDIAEMRKQEDHYIEIYRKNI